ncbi:LOW QUALITY PROTEIN: tonsoku-like protein [Anser cygnoides]|uniref:LOW QUALITY PROTEIN: tonsoku-like protein n=1 Tax=Anser cygnoides TaxID=8845 RepID=UPI0034D30014
MSGERALRQLQKAKEKLQRGGGGGGVEEAALCNQLGELLASHGRYAEALEEHRRELRLLEAAGDGLGCAVAHRKIGERLAELGSYQAALEHQRRHLELARALGDAAEQQRAWATIGRTHMFVEEGEEVTAALREAEGAFRTSLAIVEEKLEGLVLCQSRGVGTRDWGLLLGFPEPIWAPAGGVPVVVGGSPGDGGGTPILHCAMGPCPCPAPGRSGATLEPWCWLWGLLLGAPRTHLGTGWGVLAVAVGGTPNPSRCGGAKAVSRRGAVPRRELAAMRTRLYLNLGLVYDSLRDAGRRGRYLQRSVFVAERARLDEDLQRAYFNLGAIHLRQGQHPQALRCLQRARDCARRMQDKALESECCSSTAQVQLSLGDFAAAKRSLRTAYALGSRQPHQRHLVRCNLRYATKVTRLQEALEEAAGEPAAAMALCERLGDVFSRHGDFRRALEHYQRQLSYAEALGRPAPELAAIHVSLATTFGDLQEPARAEHHYRQELALHRGDALEEGRTWLSIALAKEEAGEPRAELEACLGTALERGGGGGRAAAAASGPAAPPRAAAAGRQRRGRRHHGEAAGPAGGEEEEEEEEEEQEGSEAPEEESDLELSESEGEDDELDGYTKSVPGRRRICKWNRRNDRGETPLHRACIEGDLRRVQLYLKQGHPLNPRDYCGWTPLHEACNHGHLEIVRLLLDRGAAVDDAGGPGCEGITPLHDALGCGHFEVAELLVQRGASLAARNAKGLTPLGTLEEWIGLYGKELDQETWQRCRATERLLKETAAAGGAPAAPRDSQLFDAELSEPLIAGGEDAAGAQAEPGDPDTSPPGHVPAAARGKRPRGAEAAAPDPAAPAGGQAEYEAAIRGLGSARSLPVPVPVPVPTASPRPALIPAEEYVEDWLEDDLAAAAARGARKRSRREPGDGAGEPGAARRRQNRPVGRAAPGRGRERPESPGSPARAAEGSAEAGGEEAQVRGWGWGWGWRGPPGVLRLLPSPSRPPGPALPPPIRVRVRVQDNVFLIPVPQSDGRAVGWLAAQAAERYYQACGLLPRLTLTKEGALLAPQDLVGDVLQSNEEVLAEVQCWDLPPLAERYRKACRSLALEPQPLLLKATELQEQSPAFSAGGLAPRPPQLPPLLRALKLQAPLRQLRLGGCGLADGHGAELSAALSTLPGLVLLDLSGNRLGARGLQHLAEPGVAFQSLEELDLSLNPLGDAGCRPLALLLRACPALTALRLRACGFADGFSRHCRLGLSDALAGASQLRALALSCNALGAAGLEPLLRSLPAGTLGHLDIGSVGGPDPRPLAAAVGSFLERGGCALAHLALPGNGLDDAAVAEVARRLPACPSLVSLDLSANPGISAVGLRTLLSALGERSQGLRYLSLAGCSVEGPLDGTTWARAAAGVRDLRLCGRGVSRRDQRDAGQAWRGPPGTGLCAVARHRKLFCTSL